MIRLPITESNERRYTLTYELTNGDRVEVDRKAVEMGGAPFLKHLAESLGEEISASELWPVRQGSRPVGWLPSDADPLFLRSSSLFYDVRPDDFAKGDREWIAAPSLGPGDLDAVLGFRRNKQ